MQSNHFNLTTALVNFAYRRAGMFGFGPVTKHIGVETATSSSFQYVAVLSLGAAHVGHGAQNRYGRGCNRNACAPSGGCSEKIAMTERFSGRRRSTPEYGEGAHLMEAVAGGKGDD